MRQSHYQEFISLVSTYINITSQESIQLLFALSKQYLRFAFKLITLSENGGH